MQRRSLIVGMAASAALPRIASAAAPTVGVTLPLTGVQAEVARDLEIGYRMAFAELGVAVRVMDDESAPDKVAANVRALANDPSVVALSGIVGTPHAEAGLKAAKAGGLPVVGIRSGARHLRNGEPTVFHLRASYEDELDKMVAYCVGASVKRMAIIFSEDSFGTSSRDHLVKRLSDVGIEVGANVGVERNGSNIAQAAKRAADVVKQGGMTAVALLLIVKPMMAAARELRGVHKIMGPILAMSFTITRTVATSQDDALTGLGLVTAFPLPRVGMNAVAGRYRAALEREKQPTAMRHSVTGYEGFFYGHVVGRAITSGGSTRDMLVRTLSGGVALAPDMRISFGNDMVGFRYLQFLHKSTDGLLRG